MQNFRRDKKRVEEAKKKRREEKNQKRLEKKLDNREVLTAPGLSAVPSSQGPDAAAASA